MTPEQIATLPDRLLSAAHPYAEVTLAEMAALLTEAAQRICALEEELLAERRRAEMSESVVRRLRGAIALHRSERDWAGGKQDCDRRLWEQVADVPWGVIEGDG